MTIELLLISSSHSKTKFSEIKKTCKKLINQKTCNNLKSQKGIGKYKKFNISSYDKKINEWNILEISPEDFENAF